jgi:hypothetical protein
LKFTTEGIASDERCRFEFTAYHRAKASRDGIVERRDDYLEEKTNFARPASWISSRICGRFFIAPELVSSPSELAAGFKLKNTRLYLQSTAYRRNKRRYCRLAADAGAALFIR